MKTLVRLVFSITLQRLLKNPNKKAEVVSRHLLAHPNAPCHSAFYLRTANGAAICR